MGLFDFFRATPTPEKYAQLLSAALAEAGHGAPMRYDPEQFRLVGSGDGPQIVNLENGYRAYCQAARKDRAQVLSGFARSLRPPTLPASFAEARPLLRPLIRGRGTLEYLRLLPQTLDGDRKPYIDASAPFSSDSVLMLACDSELSIQTLTGATLAAWGVTFEQALAAATDNLRDVTVSSFEQVASGIYVGGWGDGYETSRLLFSDLFYRLPLGGEPVVMAPSRHKLLVASANDKTALIGMMALARAYVEQEGRQVSALMYCFEHGKPVEFIPQDDNVARLAAELKKLFLVDDYQAQKQLLDQLHTAAKLDVFVASYKLLQERDTGAIHSYGVWTDQVDTLLPEVDKVTLVRYHEQSGAPEIRVVEWAELRAHVQELQHSVPGYPARYRLPSFPSLEQLDALRSSRWEAGDQV